MGASVRIVLGSEDLSASAFHPKLYLVTCGAEVTVLSGSGNLTRGGLETNVEQYEELRLAASSDDGAAHAQRFELLWSLGIDIEEARESGAWDQYREWAAEARERREEDAREERRAAARMQVQLQHHRGETFAKSRRGATGAERLRSILEEATGLPAVVSRGAYVMLDAARGTTTIQRAGLEVWGAALVAAVWPAELKPQAHALYPTGRAAALLDAVEGSDDLMIEARPHLAFRWSDRDQRVYLRPTIGLREYVRSWADEDLARVSYAPSQLRGELFPWLLKRGYASPRDEAKLPEFERVLGRRPIHLRPGLSVWREWPLEMAEQLDARGHLVHEVRTALDRLLAALGEPPLSG
jgi:hypothetical protein